MGDNTGDIQKSYTIGDVTANTSSTVAYVGGLVGTNSNVINSTYTTGVLSILTSSSIGTIGGLVGILSAGNRVCNSHGIMRQTGSGMGGAMACALIPGAAVCECAAGTPGGLNPAESTTSGLQSRSITFGILGLGFSYATGIYSGVLECTICTGAINTLTFSLDEVPGQTGLVKLNAACP